jgi:hypothetical protein
MRYWVTIDDIRVDDIFDTEEEARNYVEKFLECGCIEPGAFRILEVVREVPFSHTPYLMKGQL